MKLLHHTSFFLFTVLLLSSPMQSWSQAFFPAYQGGLNALKKSLKTILKPLIVKKLPSPFPPLKNKQ